MRAQLASVLMVAQALRDPTTGLNAHIDTLQLFPGHTRPPYPAAVVDTATHDEAVTGQMVSGKPFVIVMAPSDWQMEGSIRTGHRREMQIPIGIVLDLGSNGAGAAQYRQIEYTIDAAQGALDVWLMKQPRDRELQGVTVLRCAKEQRKIRKTDAGGLTAALILYLDLLEVRSA